jgi:hypothetical protein
MGGFSGSGSWLPDLKAICCGLRHGRYAKRTQVGTKSLGLRAAMAKTASGLSSRGPEFLPSKRYILWKLEHGRMPPLRQSQLPKIEAAEAPEAPWQ